MKDVLLNCDISEKRMSIELMLKKFDCMSVYV